MTKENNLIPQHIGIIIDGNRRWAKAHNLPSFEGHRLGFDKVKEIAEYALEKGVKIMTIYAFSTENWKRSRDEVNYLLGLFKILLQKEANYLLKKGIKLQILGDRVALSDDLQEAIVKAENLTKVADKGVLNICFNYGGRDELVKAVKKIVASGIAEVDINEDAIKQNLYTKNIIDPDFIIRTSGEQRLSGFLTWQSVYSELYFAKKMWPEFEKEDFDIALEEYSNRQRRFGGN
jgi:undecaprenyl diphosphate synthase